MKEMTQAELLDIFERFGDRAQDAVTFLQNNSEAARSMNTSREPRSLDNLSNGVYIIEGDRVTRWSPETTPREGAEIGCVWDGHRWIVGRQYGPAKWTEVDGKELKDSFGIVKEFEAIHEWNFDKYRKELSHLWRHWNFRVCETMPTAPIMTAMLILARDYGLNSALEACGRNPICFGEDYWFAQRYSVYLAWFFSAYYGSVVNGSVNTTNRVQAVAHWE